MAYLQLSESEVLKAILDLLSRHPLVCFAYRQSVGAYKIGSRTIRYGTPGAADISGMLKDGRRLEIEVKRPGIKTASMLQLKYLNIVNEYNGVGILTSDVETVIQCLGKKEAQENMRRLIENQLK